MKNRLLSLFALLIISSANSALAGLEAITINGKRVTLNSNHTWEYIQDEKSTARYAHLSVANLQGGSSFCRLGLKLKNDLADKINSIVFMLSAYIDEEVRYETISKGFQHLKPTQEMYNEITFSDISCDEIQYIRVHGADRCEIGELHKFSPEKGKCLKLVNVEGSDKVVIFKRYEDQAPVQEVVETKKTQAETVEERWARELARKKKPQLE